MASLGAAAAPGPSRAAQFTPRAPPERLRVKQQQGGSESAAAAAARVDPSFAALLQTTREDTARVDARREAGRGRGGRSASAAGGRGAGPASAASERTRAAPAAPAQGAFKAALAHAPTRAAAAPTRAEGDKLVSDKPPALKRGRPAAKDKAEAALAAAAMQAQQQARAEAMEVDEEEEGAAPAGSAAWVDTERYYPSLLPFPQPPQRDGADAASPLTELGLQEGCPDGRLLLMQLPALLPICAPGGAKGPCALEALPDGRLGTLLVHQSGAVKLRVGEVLFNVLPAAPLAHCEQIAALNPGAGRAAFLGTARARVVLTPDVAALLEAADT